LQFSTLDLDSGELSPPESGDSGDSSESTAGGSDSDNSDGGSDSDNSDGGSGSSNPMFSYIGMLAAATISGWAVVYWRLTR
jgi:hypothetical protein